MYEGAEGGNTFVKLMLVSIYRGLDYVEVKEVAVFVLHRQRYAIHIIVAALRITQNMWLRCLVVNLFKGLSTNIESGPRLSKAFH